MFSDPVAVVKFLVEVGIFIGVFYYLLKFFEGTRGAQVLTGLVLGIGVLWAISWLFDLEILNWALRQLSVWMVLGVFVLFAPEIRRAFAGIGLGGWTNANTGNLDLVNKIVESTTTLADRKIGALIAIERDIGLKAYRDRGTQLDSAVEPQLLSSIFYPQAPLHDGGVIIAGNRIAAACCVFPLSDKEVSGNLGTRHRAALGLSEETDAVVVVVSEETGGISLAHKGRLSRGLDEERLTQIMGNLLRKKKAEGAEKKTAESAAASAAPETAAVATEVKVEEVVG